MATRLQTVSELTGQALHKLTHSVNEWLSFLDSAAWLYRYPWHEQVMIYAQKPGARACAEMPLWNKRFQRWVNMGAKGIAIIDDSGVKPKLRHVFDVADTNSRRNIPFRLWEVRESYEAQILEELQNHFGEIPAYEGLPFSDQIVGIIHNAVADNHADYTDELMRSLPGSALGEYDDFNIKVWFEEIIELSVGYCVLTRLGYEVKTGVKHMAVRPPGKERFVRLRSLGERYTEEAIRQRILQQRAPVHPPRPEPPKVLRVRVQGDFRLSKITWKGLRALYFFYLRKLRAAQRQPQGKASYLLREDLRNLDALDAQSRFLFRHGMDTAEQLLAYRNTAGGQLQELYVEPDITTQEIEDSNQESIE